VEGGGFEAGGWLMEAADYREYAKGFGKSGGSGLGFRVRLQRSTP
jgi:hypothetical protein